MQVIENVAVTKVKRKSWKNGSNFKITVVQGNSGMLLLKANLGSKCKAKNNDLPTNYLGKSFMVQQI